MFSLIQIIFLFVERGFSMADPVTVTAVAMLAPYFAKAGEAVAQKAGEGAWKIAESLYQKIHAKFVKDQDNDAEETLQFLAQQPQSQRRQNALADILTEKVQADPTF